MARPTGTAPRGWACDAPNRTHPRGLACRAAPFAGATKPDSAQAGPATSGSLGARAFEALSRGATFALLVDDGTEARGLIREKQTTLGLAGHSRVFKRDATKLGAISAMDPFSVVFCDPPYRRGLGEKALISAQQGGWLEAGALVVLEEAGDVEIALPEEFKVLERRDYGETQVVILRAG